MNCNFAGMNFLAHAYLSFNHPQILAGNMISDFVKGAARLGFSGNVANGIILHRNIDEYTDNHPATKKAREIFRPSYRLYSGAIMDILYDYFLANDPNEFDQGTLYQFTKDTYKHLEDQSSLLPPNFLHAFTYMRMENWLFHYHTFDGIHKSLKGLIRRAAYLTESDTAFTLFKDHNDKLRDCYNEFFPDVKQFAKSRMMELVI